MANDLQSTVWAFIVGALRVILFLICILTVFVVIISLWSLIRQDMTASYSAISNKQTIYIYISHVQFLFQLIVASVGIYAVYSGNPKYLRLFALLLFIFAVLSFLKSTTQIVTNDRNNVMAKFSKHMKVYAKDYQFKLSPHEEPNQATRTWDFFHESLGCCGLNSWEDWQHWRPDLSESHQLPKSCCIKRPRSSLGVCTTSSPDIHEDGCGQALDNFLQVSSFPDIIQSLLIRIVLVAIALVVAKHRDSHNVVRCLSKGQKLEASV